MYDYHQCILPPLTINYHFLKANVVKFALLTSYNVHHFRFRRQHEQLRAVIVRVLQPPTVSQASPPSPGGPPKTVEDEEAKPEALLDPADANAIQEVNLAYENVKEVDGLDVSKDGSEAWEAAIKRFDIVIKSDNHCQ